MRPQDIVTTPAKSAIFLTLTVRPGREGEARAGIAEIAALHRSVSFRNPESLLTVVVGIGAEAWDRLYGVPRPAYLHPFEPIGGGKHTAVATPGDLLVHVRATQMDVCFELARHAMTALGSSVEAVDEVHGFRYWDDRDLLGFVDGTENPTGPDALDTVYLSPEQDATWAGGSYVIVQKYVHDMTAWDSLSVEEQERVIGRTKHGDIEIPDDVRPTNSHVTANTIEDPDGTEHDIFRQNLPFGSVGDGVLGTYFIGYAADPGTTELMLRRMFIGEPPGNYDRILDFSTAETGCLFFLPPADFLDDPEPYLAAASASGTASANESTPGRASDGSLGIGSLKRSAS